MYRNSNLRHSATQSRIISPSPNSHITLKKKRWNAPLLGTLAEGTRFRMVVLMAIVGLLVASGTADPAKMQSFLDGLL
jgi:hypothetical protein